MAVFIRLPTAHITRVEGRDENEGSSVNRRCVLRSDDSDYAVGHHVTLVAVVSLRRPSLIWRLTSLDASTLIAITDSAKLLANVLQTRECRWSVARCVRIRYCNLARKFSTSENLPFRCFAYAHTLPTFSFIHTREIGIFFFSHLLKKV